MKKIISTYRIITIIIVFIALLTACMHFINWPANTAEIVSCFTKLSWKVIRFALLILTPVTFFIKVYKNKIQSQNPSFFHKSLFAEVCLLLLFVLLSVFSYLGNKTVELVFLPLLAYISFGLNRKDLFLEVFSSQVLILITAVILFLLGLTENISYYQHGFRQAIGFSHPNSAALCVFSITVTLCLLFFSERKIPLKKIILFSSIYLFVCFTVFLITKSRTPFIASILILLSNILCAMIGSLYLTLTSKNVFTKLFPFFPALCFILVIILGFVLNIDLFHSSNFSYRFYEGISALKEHGITFLGKEINNYTLDNNYYCILLRSGLLTFIFYIFICCLSCYKAIKNQDISCIIFLLAFHLYQTMESFIPLFPLLYIEFSYICCYGNNKNNDSFSLI